MFTCHQNYTANVMLTNNTCAPLVVQSVNLSAVTTTGQCVPPSAAMYAGSTVGAGQTTAVLDLKTNPFCCTSPGCPASFQCDETYTFDVVTASGTFTGSATTHLSLDSCDVICP